MGRDNRNPKMSSLPCSCSYDCQRWTYDGSCKQLELDWHFLPRSTWARLVRNLPNIRNLETDDIVHTKFLGLFLRSLNQSLRVFTLFCFSQVRDVASVDKEPPSIPEQLDEGSLCKGRLLPF